MIVQGWERGMGYHDLLRWLVSVEMHLLLVQQESVGNSWMPQAISVMYMYATTRMSEGLMDVLGVLVSLFSGAASGMHELEQWSINNSGR
eukprot:1061280-Amorphochlora_amoeboformis.AAC.2